MEAPIAMKASQQLLLPIASLLLCIVTYLFSGKVLEWSNKSSRRLLGCAASFTKQKSSKEALLESSSPVVTKQLDFSNDWWTSDKLFQLEKRAIFSKTWLHVCHSSLFKKAGDYRTFNIADFSFLIVLGKDGQLRAFHNVCRHRAYNVVDKSEGSCTVLRCRYHGWSYDTKGKLIKAPKFEEAQGFDKSQNGLFEIRTFIDSSGFLYVNFDVYGSDGLTIRVGVPIRARLTLIESWSAEASVNWKITIPSGAFRVSSLTFLLRNRLIGLLSEASGLLENWRWPAEFELSPLTRLMRSSNGEQWLTITATPTSNKKSVVHCAFYSSRQDLKTTLPISAVQTEIKESIKKLETLYQEVCDSGDIPDTQSQEPLLAEIKAHSRLERLIGKEVFPASRMRETSQACKVADDLCTELEQAAAFVESGSGAPSGQDPLAW